MAGLSCAVTVAVKPAVAQQEFEFKVELPAPSEHPSIMKVQPPLKVFVGTVTIAVRGSIIAALERGECISITIEVR